METLKSLLPNLDLPLKCAPEDANGALNFNFRLVRSQQARVRTLRGERKCHDDESGEGSNNSLHSFLKVLRAETFEVETTKTTQTVNYGQTTGYSRGMKIL